MSGRAYLSIGDVLTLLREEFPDVTISKIRFLESQGLVNPERSPSGYRKFFEHDVERLRWVLRQQREHFLPLKVIRDRLAAGDLSDVGPEDAEASEGAAAGATASTVRRNGKVPQPAHAAVGASVGGSSAAGVTSGGLPDHDSASEHRVDGRTEEQSVKADQEAMARILADASRRAARIPDNGNGNGNERTALRVVPDLVEPTNGKTSEVSDSAKAPPRPPVRPAAASATPPAAAPRPPVKAAVTEPVADTPVEASPETVSNAPTAVPSVGKAAASEAAVAAVAESRVSSGSGAAKATPGPSASPETAKGPEAGGATQSDKSASAVPAPAVAAPMRSSALQGMVTGASLTTEELCAASGLSEAELTALQGFGLIESVMVAGIPTFNEDALTVANLASEFRKFGIEPRHLRLYRNAVDREMGLIEQVIIPLLRQRNPESRQRAVDGAEELGALGQTMRAALLRSALRSHLGG